MNEVPEKRKEFENDLINKIVINLIAFYGSDLELIDEGLAKVKERASKYIQL